MMKTEDIINKFHQSQIGYNSNLKTFYVYALYDEDEVVYIGQTSQLEYRLKAHGKNKDFNKYSFITCGSYDEMIEIETNLIIELQPKYNSKVSKNHISLNGFRNIIKEISGDEYNSTLYINRIKENLIKSDIPLINFKGGYFLERQDLDRAKTLILGQEG